MANFTNIRFTRFFGKSLFFAMIMVSFAMVSFGQKTTISDGNWSNPAIWSPSGVPAVGADVTINNNVILDVNPPALKKVKVNLGGIPERNQQHYYPEQLKQQLYGPG